MNELSCDKRISNGIIAKVMEESRGLYISAVNLYDDFVAIDQCAGSLSNRL